jgi:hypothetical protein
MLPSIHFPPVELPRHNVQSLYKLPDEVKYCTRCVISNQRPRITFNEEGVCSACQFAEVKKGAIDWAKREEELQTLCDKHRRNAVLMERKLESIRGALDSLRLPGTGSGVEIYDRLGHVSRFSRGRGYNEA